MTTRRRSRSRSKVLGPAYFVTWHIIALEALVKTGHLAPRQLAAIRRHYTENPAAILRGLDSRP